METYFLLQWHLCYCEKKRFIMKHLQKISNLINEDIEPLLCLYATQSYYDSIKVHDTKYNLFGIHFH